eukprot:6204546-Pleurochrysis_carterae.AAC.1
MRNAATASETDMLQASEVRSAPQRACSHSRALVSACGPAWSGLACAAGTSPLRCPERYSSRSR